MLINEINVRRTLENLDNKYPEKTIGYIRLFTGGTTLYRTLRLHIKYLKEEKGCHEVFFEKVKAGDWSNGANFTAILETMKPTDTLFVLKLEFNELLKIRVTENGQETEALYEHTSNGEVIISTQKSAHVNLSKEGK